MAIASEQQIHLRDPSRIRSRRALRAGFVHNLEEANALLDVAEGRLEQ